MKMMQTLGMMVGALAVLLGGASARATIVTPVSVTASSEYNQGGDDRRAIHTIDSSGLNLAGQHDEFYTTLWLANGVVTPTITWNLGAAYQLTGLHLWNYNGEGETLRGTQSADIRVSNDPTFATFLDLGPTTFAVAPGTAGYLGADYALVTSTPYQYVRFNVLSNFGDSFASGLSEIRFEAIPEPSTVLLLSVGGLVLFRLRHGYGGQGRRRN